MVKTLRISDEKHKEMLKIQGEIQAKSEQGGYLRPRPHIAIEGRQNSQIPAGLGR